MKIDSSSCLKKKILCAVERQPIKILHNHVCITVPLEDFIVKINHHCWQNIYCPLQELNYHLEFVPFKIICFTYDATYVPQI